MTIVFLALRLLFQASHSRCTQASKAWSDYFPGVPSKSSLQISHTNKGQFYVHSSAFLKLYRTGAGGAVYIYTGSEESKLLFEYTLFLEDHCDNQGGAVYYCCTKGSFIMTKTCSSGCFGNTGSSGQFLFSRVMAQNDHPNFLTLSNCVKNGNPSRGYGPFYFGYGQQQAKTLNLSQNQVLTHGGLYLEVANGKANVKFCTFDSNIASSSYCIGFGGGSSYLLTKCNILNNQQKDFLIYSSVSTFVTGCIILNNKDHKKIFNGENIVFYDSVLYDNEANNMLGDILSQTEIDSQSFTMHLIHIEVCNESFGITELKPQTYAKVAQAECPEHKLFKGSTFSISSSHFFLYLFFVLITTITLIVRLLCSYSTCSVPI